MSVRAFHSLHRCSTFKKHVCSESSSIVFSALQTIQSLRLRQVLLNFLRVDAQITSCNHLSLNEVFVRCDYIDHECDTCCRRHIERHVKHLSDSFGRECLPTARWTIQQKDCVISLACNESAIKISLICSSSRCFSQLIEVQPSFTNQAQFFLGPQTVISTMDDIRRVSAECSDGPQRLDWVPKSFGPELEAKL